MRRIFLTQQTTSSVCAIFDPAHAPVHLAHPFVRVPRCAARLSFGGGLAFEGSWAFEHCPLRRHARRAPHHVVCQVVAAAILCMDFRHRLVSLKHAGDVKRAMRPTCRWTADGWADTGKQGDGLANCRFQAGSKPNGDGSRSRAQTRIHLLLISTLAAAVPKWLWIRRRLR